MLKKNHVKLSVLLVTYNHEEYIEEALESILIQKFNDNYEIVVADDLSTDNTVKIINKYKEIYPEKIRILVSNKNLGITKNYERGFKACKGEYIAVLEGDDYWTTPEKLQKHVDFLDNHRDCVLSFNRFIVSSVELKIRNIQPWFTNSEYELIQVTDLIKNNFIGNFSTCVYRADIIGKIDNSLFKVKNVYDWMFNIVVGGYGKIGYLPEVMSVYRLHEKGTWTQKSQVDKLKEIIESIEIYDEYLEGVYEQEFNEHKTRLYAKLNQLLNPKQDK